MQRVRLQSKDKRTTTAVGSSTPTTPIIGLKGIPKAVVNNHKSPKDNQDIAHQVSLSDLRNLKKAEKQQSKQDTDYLELKLEQLGEELLNQNKSSGLQK